MATMARPVPAVLAMLWGMQIARSARTGVGGFALQGETSGACPRSLPELPHLSEEIRGQCPASQFGTLHVGCISASGLKKKRFFRDNRALCRVEIVSKTQTRVAPRGKKPARKSAVLETPVALGKNPEWKSAFRFGFACADAAEEMQDSMIQVQIKDEDPLVGAKTNLGYAYVDFARFSDFSGGAAGEYDLGGHRAGGAAGNAKAKGRVKLALRWCPLGDERCLSDAGELEGLSVAGADWTDCHDGCHNKLMETLTPVYDLERKRMAASVKAAELVAKYASRAEKYRREAAELDAWLAQHPIAEKWKRWRKVESAPCVNVGLEWEAPCPPEAPLTREQEFALLWQSKARARKQNAAAQKEFKLKHEQFEQNRTVAYAKGRLAMDTVGGQLADGAASVCGRLVAPFMEEAAARIPKMPDGEFDAEKAEEALKQLDAVWESVADLKDCLLAKWKHGDLLPSREPGALGGACFEAMAG